MYVYVCMCAGVNLGRFEVWLSDLGRKKRVFYQFFSSFWQFFSSFWQFFSSFWQIFSSSWQFFSSLAIFFKFEVVPNVFKFMRMIKLSLKY